jgi:hypothetical protein
MDFVVVSSCRSSSLWHSEWWHREQFQRQYWNPHWNRVPVEEEDRQMKIGPAWVQVASGRKRKAFWAKFWQARFKFTVAAKCKLQCPHD